MTENEITEALAALAISVSLFGGTVKQPHHGLDAHGQYMVTVSFDRMLHAAEWVGRWNLEATADTLVSDFNQPLDVTFPLANFYQEYATTRLV